MSDFSIDKISYTHTYIIKDTEWHIPARKDNFLAYHIGGIYEHRNGDSIYVAKHGTCIFLNKNDAFDVVNRESGAAICMAFEGDVKTESFAIDCPENTKIRNLFEKMLAHRNFEKESNYYINLSAAYEIIAVLTERREAAAYRNRFAGKKIYEAYRYISENYTDRSLTNDYLAELCGMGNRRFITLFESEFHITPRQYLISRRIELAASLLKSQVYTIEQISEATGFCDTYYFNRCFRQHMNMPPGEYRRLANQKSVDKQE